MRETKTESELNNLCEEIVEHHQKEFEKILKRQDSDYDGFINYWNLTNNLQKSLELAVNKFNPNISNILQLNYARLKQYSIMYGFYLDFFKKNNEIIRKKFINPQ